MYCETNWPQPTVICYCLEMAEVILDIPRLLEDCQLACLHISISARPQTRTWT